MRKIIFSILFLLFFCGTVFAAPQAIIVNTQNRLAVKDKIVEMMLGISYTLKNSNDYQVVFEKELKGVGAALFWNIRTGKNPVNRVIWGVLPETTGLKVTAESFGVASPGTGWEMVVPITDKDENKALLIALFKLKAMIEGEDEVYLMRTSGLFPEMKPEIVSSEMKMEGRIISSITRAGTADKAALKAGDIVLEINGKEVTDNILSEIDARLSEGRAVILTIERDGIKDVATLKGD